MYVHFTPDGSVTSTSLPCLSQACLVTWNAVRAGSVFQREAPLARFSYEESAEQRA